MLLVRNFIGCKVKFTEHTNTDTKVNGRISNFLKLLLVINQVRLQDKAIAFFHKVSPHHILYIHTYNFFLIFMYFICSAYIYYNIYIFVYILTSYIYNTFL